jgi:hypothetical protein
MDVLKPVAATALTLVAWVGGAGCALKPADCAFYCLSDGTCPESLVCGDDGYCHGAVGSPPCGPLATDGGVDGPACAGCVGGGPYNYAFVTSKTYSPGTAYIAGAQTFASLADADQICNDRARAAHVPGTFVAWLSDSGHRALDRLRTPAGAPAGGWVRLDLRPFATSVEALVGGQVLFPLRLDETGADLGSDRNVLVATGTSTAGLAMDTANDWRTTSAACTTGALIATTTVWTADGPATPCSDLRLYCLGVDHDASIPLMPPTGRIAFLSASPFMAGPGAVGAADQQCNQEASAAQLPGVGGYVALLSTATAAATARLSDGAWDRVDGIPWAMTLVDLARGDVLTTLNVTAGGAYLAGTVWTGSEAPGTPSAGTDCGGWASANASLMGTYGRAELSDRIFRVVEQSCAMPGRLYCLQR